MNRTDRLLAIVLELQRAGKRRAEDLAATFETSKRTIYRDMEALSEAGVPVVAVPGQGYALMAGYFLPPLSFSTDEATMLLLGSDVMAQQFDAQYRAAAQSAAAKIEGCTAGEVARRGAHVAGEHSLLRRRRAPAEQETLLHLRRAILDRTDRPLPLHGAYSERAASPRRTARSTRTRSIHSRGVWHVSGYDHLRQDTRTFRLDRIEDLASLDRTFVRRRIVRAIRGGRGTRGAI